MEKINRTKDENGYDRFKIITDEGNFDIIFGGNLDLYWFYWPKETINDWPLSKTFIITKENYFLYQTLDELYTRIKDQKPFPKDNNKDIFLLDEQDLNDFKKTDYAHDELFQNNIIKWYSDDSPLENASNLEIRKLEDAYSITFNQGLDETYFKTYSIRFRNSGSRYSPYNFTFMNMYNRLSKYNPDYHQIHIEEYLYAKKLQKLKK